ncbi:MAG: DUF362 domain-containing protein [Anaerolineae bacterium]|nr:DUF362 domain-containing protein [Anaerolineae bacterium]NUQ07380.1 DUF362 domain-containing protein [Anaerolineae bacterium]
MSKPDSTLSRRCFLQRAGASAAALIAPDLLLFSGAARTAPGSGAARRVYLHTFDPNATTTTEAVTNTLTAATDFSWLRQGDSVFLKVASNSNLPPPSVTSPAVLEGVIAALKAAGAGTITVGDMSGAQFVRHLADRTIGSTRENMRRNGLLAAAEAAGAAVHCFEEVPFERAYLPGVPTGAHHWGESLQVAEILDRVDHVINLPRLGKHVLAGASLGLKNAVGWISDHSRMVLHRDAATFQAKIAELNTIPQLMNKQRLTLTLADRALTTYGPDAGYALPLSRPLIIASDDVVSHDQIALLALVWARWQTPDEALAQDPYPAQSNGLNWWFVRVTWGEEIGGYQDLPTFEPLASAEDQTAVNLAYDRLHGGRPERIEVLPGGPPLPGSLAVLLTADPALGVVVQGSA